MKIEDIAFLVSVIVAVLLSISIYSLTNDLFKSVVISTMISVIVGTLILLKGEEKMKDKKLTDFVLKVIAWSLIFIGYIFLILVLFKIIHSPEENFLFLLIQSGILIELGRMETKIDILWSNFRKRKKF
jgi:hypothetical protein